MNDGRLCFDVCQSHVYTAMTSMNEEKKLVRADHARKCRKFKKALNANLLRKSKNIG